MESSDRKLTPTTVKPKFVTKGGNNECGCKTSHREEKSRRSKKEHSCESQKKTEECDYCMPVYPISSCPDVLPLLSAYNTFTEGDASTTYNGGGLIDFPTDGDMAGNGITRMSPGMFQLMNTGIYEVFFQLGVSNPSQAVVRLNNVELHYTIVGTGTASTQITGQFLIRVNTLKSILGIYNPMGNSPMIMAPSLGGSRPSNINLSIKQIS